MSILIVSYSRIIFIFINMIFLKKILKKNKYKNKIWVIVDKSWKSIVKIFQSNKLLSKYLGLPKGYYTSSLEYYQISTETTLNHVTYQEFLPASISQRNPPKSLSKRIHWKFEGRCSHSNPATFVICITNGRVIGNAGTIITHDNKLLLDVSGIYNHENYLFPYINLPKCDPILETVAVLATGAGGKYFHWLLEVLPRIEILKKTLPHGLDDIDKFIVNIGVSVIPASLEILGVPRNKLLFCDFNTHIQAKSLVVPSLPGSPGDPPAWICKFLRENFLEFKTDINTPTKLYISRSKAEYRKITNEDSVIKCLSNYGITAICLEEYNFAMQIALLSNAEIIVAPHGAGLSNLIWCNPGTKVLEIFSPNYVNVCFWAIANEVGLDYFYLIGDGNKPLDYVDPHLVHDNITVPIEKLNVLLDVLTNKLHKNKV